MYRPGSFVDNVLLRFSPPAGEEASEEASVEAGVEDSVEDSVVETATTEQLATLLAAGLEPREGVPGLFLCRDDDGWPIVPPEPIKLEGRVRELADAMRDELVTRLKEKGTEGLPTSGVTGLHAGKERADLMGVYLQGGLPLKGSTSKGVYLFEAKLEGVNLLRAQLQKIDLARAQLQGACLREAQLQEADLRVAQLQGANLEAAQLNKADLCKAQLEKAHLYQAQLKEAKLNGAHLQGANLEEAHLQEANLSGALLQQARLVRANLSNANLTKSNLASADLTSADLTKANLNEALKSMRTYRPPHPPTALASGSWRTKSVAKATAVAAYKSMAQDDDDDDDDNDDDDSSGSEDEENDGGEGKLALAPWLEAAEEVASQAAGALVAVAQPVLLLVNSMVTEFGRLCDALAKRVPEELVRSVLPLLEKQTAPPATQLQKDIAVRLNLLLKTCVLDIIFKDLLPGAIRALAKQIKQVQRWVKGEIALNPQAMVKELQKDMCMLTRKKQQDLFEQFAKDFLPSASTRAEAPTEEEEGNEADEANAANEANAADEVDEGFLDGQLRDIAGEVIGAVVEMLEDDLKMVILPDLKLQAQAKLDAFAENAAMPISTVLAAAIKSSKTTKLAQLATRLPEVRGYMEALKKELCEDSLRKRVTKQLMGAASTPLQSIGHGAEQTLALAGRFEQHLEKKLNTVKEAGQKLLRRHLPQGSLRARAIDVVLKTTTKYNVSVVNFKGSFEMLCMAWQRSRVELNTDENQLVYLSEKLKKLEDKESTAANWRDSAEGWISVLELRGQLHVQCGQSVLECMAADEKVREALGAAKVLMFIEGEPPAALVAIIAQGPGAHIRKHGYRYTRRLDKEVVLIRRLKEWQMRAITGVGTLLVATSVAVGNYLARVMYDGVTDGFGSQSWLTWVLPLVVLAGLLVLCCFVGLAAYLCRKKKKCWPLCARISPKGEGAQGAPGRRAGRDNRLT